MARVVSRQAEPVNDIYGLDEAPAPLPPMMPRGASSADTAVAEPPVKKKKKKGFFSSSKKKKSSGGGFQYSGPGIGTIRLIVILVVVAGSAIGGLGFVSKSGVESFHQTLIAQRAELLAALRPIRSAADAGAAAPRVQDVLSRMTKHLEDNGFKKGRKEDVQEMSSKYGGKHMADTQAIIREFSRVAMIPGALQALGIEGHMQRLDAIEKRLARDASSN